MTVKNKDLSTKVGLLISYYIVLSFWSAQNLGLSMVSRNIAGATKKSTVVAATFVSWAVGNAIGKYPLYKYPPRLHIANIVILNGRPTSIPRTRLTSLFHCLWSPPRLLFGHDSFRYIPAFLSCVAE